MEFYNEPFSIPTPPLLLPPLFEGENKTLVSLLFLYFAVAKVLFLKLLLLLLEKGERKKYCSLFLVKQVKSRYGSPKILAVVSQRKLFPFLFPPLSGGWFNICEADGWWSAESTF